MKINKSTRNDVTNWQYFYVNNGLSSWYDFNFDGYTNQDDLAIIQQHLGTNCLKQEINQTPTAQHRR